MRSVAWAAGTLVLLEIFIDIRKNWRLLLPWFASLMATMVTLMTWGRGILLTNSKADLLDSILPTLMGITEVCLFSILSPRLNRVDPNPDLNKRVSFEPWHWWLLVLAIHALLAVFLVWNRISLTDIVNDFDLQLQPLAKEYMQWMHDDRFGAAIGFGWFFGLWMLMTLVIRRVKFFRCGLRYATLYAFLALLPIGIYSLVVYNAEKQRQRTDEFVFSVPTKSVELGQSPEQIEGILGQPERKGNLGSKVVYVYRDMKIIFLNGKVSDVQ